MGWFIKERWGAKQNLGGKEWAYVLLCSLFVCAVQEYELAPIVYKPYCVRLFYSRYL
jgi:hypothetical protein